MAINILENITLADYSIFKIGGLGRFFCRVKSESELVDVLNWAGEKGTPVFILGAGSNILVPDKGYDGLVIKNELLGIRTEGNKVYAEAGVFMARAVDKSVKAGLSGFEWGIGIPGTIGGSIRGNAGCFGGEMRQVLEQVRVLEVPSLRSAKRGYGGQANSKIKIIELSNSDCKFGYRHSIFKENPNWIIVSAVLKLQRGDMEESGKKILEYTKHRNETQDIGSKCAGCAFKNVEWNKIKDKESFLKKFQETRRFEQLPYIPSGFLIDQSGLKGESVGNITVSRKHANYIINNGGGKAKDVLSLMSLIKKKVAEKFRINLEEEVQILW